MTAWTAWVEELKKLNKPLSTRYELRPREDGVIIFCTTCCIQISDKTLVVLVDILKEAQEHETHNHERHARRTL